MAQVPRRLRQKIPAEHGTTRYSGASAPAPSPWPSTYDLVLSFSPATGLQHSLPQLLPLRWGNRVQKSKALSKAAYKAVQQHDRDDRATYAAEHGLPTEVGASC